ncbi:hypothetical protein MMC22_006145 [Lobaria immixta]|nr:hypothetical protein [Lobaria immixta]
MPRFLLLVMTSIWTRISCSATILEPSVPDGTSLMIDTANLFDPGTSNFNSKVAAIDVMMSIATTFHPSPNYALGDVSPPTSEPNPKTHLTAKRKRRQKTTVVVIFKRQTKKSKQIQAIKAAIKARQSPKKNLVFQSSLQPKTRGLNAASIYAAYSNMLCATTRTRNSLVINLFL